MFSLRINDLLESWKGSCCQNSEVEINCGSSGGDGPIRKCEDCLGWLGCRVTALPGSASGHSTCAWGFRR
jgi:hypothetical protein